MTIRVKGAHSTDDTIYCTLDIEVPGASGTVTVKISGATEAGTVVSAFAAEWMNALGLICKLYDEHLLKNGSNTT